MYNCLRRLLSKNGFYWFLFYSHKLLGMERLLSDKKAIDLWSICYRGVKVNWDNPTSFNDKLNWLKIYGRNDLYTKMAGKYEAKKIVAERIGEEYVVPCYGVFDHFDDINFDALPQQFVLKCTHDCASVYVCKNKDEFDKSKVRKVMEKALKKNYYWGGGREWVYKNIKPQIVVDKFLDDGRKGELQDYKWWCFNGDPKYMYITNKGKTGQVYENFYDMDFNQVDINHNWPRVAPEFQKPATFEQMRNLASKLSKGIPFVRIDFFNVNGHIYFGEFTFYDFGGLRSYRSEEWDEKLGSLIKLPEITNN